MRRTSSESPDAARPDFGLGHSTWDGWPVSPETPHGATVGVWRERDGRREWLLLHRRHAGSEDGDWAWTPPSGARLPDEPVDACARRELFEETGLELELTRLELREDWILYLAEAPPDAEIVLDREHDAFAWLSLDEARARCRPAVVADGLAALAASLAGRAA